MKLHTISGKVHCVRAREGAREIEREGERNCRTVFICYALSFELCDLVECALRLGCVCMCCVWRGREIKKYKPKLSEQEMRKAKSKRMKWLKWTIFIEVKPLSSAERMENQFKIGDVDGFTNVDAISNRDREIDTDSESECRNACALKSTKQFLWWFTTMNR